ncbi:MAG: NUDIX domain-containing protein [Aquisalimonadaceae bacterium]
MERAPKDRLFIDHRGRMHQRPANTTARHRRGIHGLLRHGDALLLVRPPTANWLELPGGGIEDGESPVAALRRELREEAGICIDEALLTAADETRFRTRYFATSHDAYWLYQQQFRLVHLVDRPLLEDPLEPGHERFWLSMADLHRQPIHHVHRIGIDRLLSLTIS